MDIRERPRPSFLLVALALAGSLVPVSAGGVAVVNALLSDNADDDGFADTNETVELRLTLENTSGSSLTGVEVAIESNGPLGVCVTRRR